MSLTSPQGQPSDSPLCEPITSNCLNCSNPLNTGTRSCANCQSLSTKASSIATSKASNASRRVRLELQRLKEERAIQMNYIKQKYQLLTNENEDSDSSISQFETVHEWLNSQPSPPRPTNTSHIQVEDEINAPTCANSAAPPKQNFDLQSSNFNAANATNALPQANVNSTINNETQQSALQPTNSLIAPTTAQHCRTNSTFQVLDGAAHNRNPVRGGQILPDNAGTIPFPNFTLFETASEPTHQYTNLSSQQVNARQSVPKELPIFSGMPEEWPLFSSTFDWSTKVCGLTDAENLIRIQRSLRGEALRAVQHILIHPSCVAAVMSTLKMLFGQPEKILHSIKNRIKSAPPINANKLQTFTAFAVHIKGLQATIEACGLHDELNNSTLLQDLIDKLPPYYQIIWGTHKLNLIKTNKKANLQEFANWFFEVGLSANSVTVSNNVVNNDERDSKNHKHNKVFLHTHSESNKNKCCVCGGVCNNVASCNQFQSSTRDEKWSIIRKCNLCKQCLRQHSGLCRENKICGVDSCQLRHNPLLHRHAQNNSLSKTAVSQAQINNCNAHSINNQNILFKIIPIVVHGNFGRSVNTFAFIDEGSSVSLMDESIAKEVSLQGNARPLCLKWTNKIERMENSSQQINLRISGANQRVVTVPVRTVNQLSLPIQSLDYAKLCQQFSYLRNLPIETYTNAVPRVLIGVDNWKLGIPLATKEGGAKEPVAVRTRLGWLAYGMIGSNANTNDYGNYHICECSTETCYKLQELVKLHHSIENIGVIPSAHNLIAAEDAQAFKLLNRYTKQRSDRHYETGLLWRSDNFNIPDSYQMARKRFLCLERKLSADPQLLEIFNETISKYLKKGYVRKLSVAELQQKSSQRIWYLPIFAVFNKNKPGKARIVWDAAAKTQGVSLNSLLMKGPDLLVSLPAVLFRFRQKAVAVCGDIEEMFLQVVIRREDQDMQRFLWRSSADTEPDVYVTNVLLFGLSCAPCISQFVKNLNAMKFRSKFPQAAAAIEKNHYVDDFLDSVDTVKEAVKLVSEVRHIHYEGGFNIRIWSSNNSSVLKDLNPRKNDDSINLNISGEPELEKVLGVFWSPSDDFITFKTSPGIMENQIFLGTKAPTKREILRILMSIYDPLGLIGNYLMNLKILLQEIWRSNVGWDDNILSIHIDKWNTWVRTLPNLKNIKIPRCYLQHFMNYEDVELQLHTFVDASASGYAAVSYFRLAKGDAVVCSLIGSKVRVAPLKLMSIPRLELMAALIGARFADNITKHHTIKIKNKFFWSDSKTVLSWLRSDHRKYHQYVAFRVSEILDISDISNWYWVPSKLNVADEATKWAKQPDISPNSRWLNGPEYLQSCESDWPREEKNMEPATEELKQFVCFTMASGSPFDIFRFSKWKRLQRAAAFVVRFIDNIKRKVRQEEMFLAELTQDEIRRSEELIYRLAQSEAYSEEISILKLNNKTPKSSAIYKLSPYLDASGVLRIDGRINKANVSWEQKRPVILPKESYVTKLIIMHHHENLHHLNNETAINELRQKVYIPRLRTIFKTVIKSCQMCKIRKVTPQNPEMAKLPRARLSAYVAPFSFTGLDFFGPIIVTINRHKEKRYGALFTCLTIRAVHVEIVGSLNTSSCIMAIRNFIARRGTPIEFFSDNGTNFVGAERELREAIKEVDKNELVRSFTTATTKWSFNPPATPNMGGAWERLVRSIKVVLYAIMPTRCPSEELLRSMMAEIENIVNSRPLTYVPLDEENQEALTPNHLLLGSSNGMKPLATCSDSAIVLKHCWLSAQQYAQQFWRRWVAEYLPTLTCRSKWFEKVKPLSEGDLVVVVDPCSPRNVWPRGKVIETRVAKDGQVRSAKVLTTTGVLERPASKLAILDVASQKE